MELFGLLKNNHRKNREKKAQPSVSQDKFEDVLPTCESAPRQVRSPLNGLVGLACLKVVHRGSPNTESYPSAQPGPVCLWLRFTKRISPNDSPIREIVTSNPSCIRGANILVGGDI
jgi:hypothetical protein